MRRTAGDDAVDIFTRHERLRFGAITDIRRIAQRRVDILRRVEWVAAMQHPRAPIASDFLDLEIGMTQPEIDRYSAALALIDAAAAARPLDTLVLVENAARL